MAEQEVVSGSGEQVVEDVESQEQDVAQDEVVSDATDAGESTESTKTGESTTDEAGATPAPQEAKWVTDLRKKNRELTKQVRALERAKPVEKQAETATLPPKPTLSGSGYDEELFQAETDKWYAKKAEIDAVKARQEARDREESNKINQIRVSYVEAAAKLGAEDFPEAEQEVQESLSEIQQGLLLRGAVNSARLVHFIGKNPDVLDRLAQMHDPVKFAAEIGRIEANMKARTANNRPAPEKTVRSTGGVTGASNGTLDKLRADAMKTGDFTKVHQYRMAQRNK